MGLMQIAKLLSNHYFIGKYQKDVWEVVLLAFFCHIFMILLEMVDL